MVKLLLLLLLLLPLLHLLLMLLPHLLLLLHLLLLPQLLLHLLQSNKRTSLMKKPTQVGFFILYSNDLAPIQSLILRCHRDVIPRTTQYFA